MSAEIVSLTGDPIPAAAEPNKNIIEMLEEYLARAIAGDVQGVVICALHQDETVSGGRCGMMAYAIEGFLEQSLFETRMRRLQCDDEDESVGC